MGDREGDVLCGDADIASRRFSLSKSNQTFGVVD